MPYLVKGSHKRAGRDNHSAFLRDPKARGPISAALTVGDVLSDELRKLLPTVVEVEMHSPKAELTQMMTNGGDSEWFVHQVIKDWLEENEPGVHEFVPLKVRDAPTGEIIRDDYYLVLITERIKCLDEEKITWIIPKDRGTGLERAQRSKYRADYDGKHKLYLHADLIEGRHLWRGMPDLAREMVFCSDELAAFVKAEGLRGWKLIKCVAAA